MPNSRIRLLIEALRSGEYKQGHYFLHQGDCHCVLGVACEVYMKAGNQLEIGNFPHSKGPVTTYDSHHNTVPLKVQEWFGFHDSAGSDITMRLKPLFVLNDNGWNFKDLADLLEENEGYAKVDL